MWLGAASLSGSERKQGRRSLQRWSGGPSSVRAFPISLGLVFPAGHPHGGLERSDGKGLAKDAHHPLLNLVRPSAEQATQKRPAQSVRRAD
jgi:hypothetical protein